ncbi:hypothetical protein KEM48_013626 [Puccinia striiformis f. sp. tritici PST-130]|nr:hypothetical protein KEM48_013626 [Puccinia striiformis f. sp. tritici PST-130]
MTAFPTLPSQRWRSKSEDPEDYADFATSDYRTRNLRDWPHWYLACETPRGCPPLFPVNPLALHLPTTAVCIKQKSRLYQWVSSKGGQLKLTSANFQLVYMFLKSTLETVTRLAHPLDPEYLLRKGLMPEAALCLIGLDMSLPMSHPKVRATFRAEQRIWKRYVPRRMTQLADSHVDCSQSHVRLINYDSHHWDAMLRVGASGVYKAGTTFSIGKKAESANRYCPSEK